MDSKTKMSDKEIKKYLKDLNNNSTLYDIGILGTIIVVLILAAMMLVSFYLTGWALTYITHMLIDSPYYTDILTRILLGLATWFVLGGLGTREIVKKSSDKLNNN